MTRPTPEEQRSRLPDEAPRLARIASYPWRSYRLPVGVDREDLESIAMQHIIDQAQRAWDKGVSANARILVAKARGKISEFVEREERAPATEDASEPLAPEPPPSALIDDLLGVLDPGARRIVARRFGLDGHEVHQIREIASAEDIHPSTVERSLSRALDAMARSGQAPREAPEEMNNA